MAPDLARDAWVAYLTQYLGLGLVFFFGIFIGIRNGELSLAPGRGRRWLLTLLAGYGLYAFFHGLFQFCLVRI